MADHRTLYLLNGLGHKLRNLENRVTHLPIPPASLIKTHITGATYITDNTDVKTALEELDAILLLKADSVHTHPISDIIIGGTPDGTKFLRDDGFWAVAAGGGTDPDAIHDNVANEISAITEKVTLVSADLLIIEDSADSNNKKKIQIGNLPRDVDGGNASSIYLASQNLNGGGA